ncbi:aminoglycoside 6-adenylyltransferase [Harryflintia acetispora]|uniref:Aminoglycoside 6-adenylyltransferase n=1 Tax=Harryflintia acetispora TaxID=1849041 RepID=A0A9X8UIH7_9FIRM|nr:aminoglycoside 6-adenylyltransferase [Harryflintia acetispora]TCL42759.1 aminoglycoside 6-adenylyltransferase [Harryflintia acetispora]
MGRYDRLIDRIVRWGEQERSLHAILEIGSQAREDHPADESSDLDLILVVDEPSVYIESDDWLKKIGPFHISFVENTVADERERRVLFDGALDVDFVLLSKSSVQKLASREVRGILGRGCRVLIDKIGLADRLPGVSPGESSCYPPTRQKFENVVNDFWYHAILTGKKLRRGELWAAKFCVDSYMKWRLLWMTEAYAHALHGPDYDTWHEGRFLEEWAEDWILKGLSQCFSHYDKDDMKAALLSTMELFGSVALKSAKLLGYPYPYGAQEYSAAWVKENLA